MRFFGVSFFLAMALSVSGCGSSGDGRVGVSGKVTHHGEPLNNGSIQFIAENGSQMAGTTINSGTYTLAPEQGLLPGKFNVRISAASESTATPVVVEGEAPGDPGQFPPRKELIAAEFNSRSTLSTQITKDGPNTYDVTIP